MHAQNILWDRANHTVVEEGRKEEQRSEEGEKGPFVGKDDSSGGFRDKTQPSYIGTNVQDTGEYRVTAPAMFGMLLEHSDNRRLCGVTFQRSISLKARMPVHESRRHDYNKSWKPRDPTVPGFRPLIRAA